MTRELRLKLAGILFYTIFALNLAFTKTGLNFLRNLPSHSGQAGTYQAVAAVLGIGALIFTSEAIGYAFSTFVYFWWNIVRGKFGKEKGGYSREWEKLSYDIKVYIIGKYNGESEVIDDNKHNKFESQWKSYGADVFLSYFWQQAPKGIVDWVMRRYTAFFVGISTVIGLILGLTLSLITILALNMDWTIANTCIAVFTLVLVSMICWNGHYARNDAWQIIDLWLAERLNPQLHNITKNLA